MSDNSVELKDPSIEKSIKKGVENFFTKRKPIDSNTPPTNENVDDGYDRSKFVPNESNQATSGQLGEVRQERRIPGQPLQPGSGELLDSLKKVGIKPLTPLNDILRENRGNKPQAIPLDKTKNELTLGQKLIRTGLGVLALIGVGKAAHSNQEVIEAAKNEIPAQVKNLSQMPGKTLDQVLGGNAFTEDPNKFLKPQTDVEKATAEKIQNKQLNPNNK